MGREPLCGRDAAPLVPAPPYPLPDGDYTWQVCAYRTNGAVTCSDESAFTIQTGATPAPNQQATLVRPSPVMTLTPTASFTPLPTSYLPRGMGLIAPPDGAVLTDPMPSFEYDLVEHSWGYEIHIEGLGEENPFRTVWLWPTGPGAGGYTAEARALASTPQPLPDGDYSWRVCVYRVADAYCSNETWTFTIDTSSE